MTAAKKLIITLMAAIFALVAFIFFQTGGGALKVCAAATAYSDVFQDLRTDKGFNFLDYPENPDDYSIQVIQIAESTDGELLIYTYQPSGKLNASSVNISKELPGDNALTFKNYGLERLSVNGVFFKYKVLNFTLNTAAVRYYSISNILRPFDKAIDEEPAEGSISEVENRVAQFWTAETVNGNVTYSMETSEVITITQKVVGYCIYDDGLTLGWGKAEGVTKAYFVAFDTDRQIDKLISADLTFWASRAHCKICLNDKHKDHSLYYDFHDPEYIDYGTGVYNNEPLKITDKQTWGNVGGGNRRPATKFLRKRIRKTSEFIAAENNEDYKLESGDSLDGTKWVLNFYEAQDKYKVDNVWLSFNPMFAPIKGVADGEAELNNVYDVSILRLEFETDGKAYNLGVVDNKQTPGNTPINSPVDKDKKDFWGWLAGLFGTSRSKAKTIFWLIIAGIICFIFLPVLGLLIPPFGRFLIQVITAPFRLIAKLVKSGKAKPKTRSKAGKKK